ncbi:ankyrin repeat domain-containing protein [Blastopirellula sp. JC732]|uniref:Ankyrin repeat domain-containing protein n=1 Tax=Blastopirellula sediminis TaxID=2894196 RepID=A0A9X1MPU3_9BACT|nr:ankyrin repeat domain-containing protein [Blastopirellula sediminis]MCC9606537.1 ankyrin repeat domain-containing protein [Blastopirellula sediminis]MCC9630165.1 ankyrin repeat domain-containing protein [Blastopirellula sediminis]
MLRGCVLALLLLAGLICGYFYWLNQVFEWPGNIIGAAIAGLVVFFCLGALQNAWTAWRDSARIGDIDRQDPLEDGKVVAVSGTIHPVSDPLIAPFSGEECVVCEYDLMSRGPADMPEQETQGSDFAGFLMVPCVIRGPRGDVRIFGFPSLEGFEEQFVHGYDAAQNAANFLRNTEFEDRSGMKLVSLLSVFGEVWSDEDGHVEKNMRLGKLTADDLFPRDKDGNLQKLAQWDAEIRQEEEEEDYDDEEDEDEEVLPEGYSPELVVPRLKEKRVPVGAEVCAIGIYDEVSRGLLPPPGTMTPNRLIKGTAAEIASGAFGKVISNIVGAIIFLAIVHAVIFGVIWANQNNSEERGDRERRAVNAASTGKLEELEGLVYRGFDVNYVDKEGHTLLMMANTPEIAKYLIDKGANVDAVDPSGDTAIWFAARQGRKEIVKLLLDAGVKEPNPRSEITGRTAIEEATMRGDQDTVEMINSALLRNRDPAVQEQEPNGQPAESDPGS